MTNKNSKPWQLALLENHILISVEVFLTFNLSWSSHLMINIHVWSYSVGSFNPTYWPIRKGLNTSWFGWVSAHHNTLTSLLAVGAAEHTPQMQPGHHLNWYLNSKINRQLFRYSKAIPWVVPAKPPPFCHAIWTLKHQTLIWDLKYVLL